MEGRSDDARELLSEGVSVEFANEVRDGRIWRHFGVPALVESRVHRCVEISTQLGFIYFNLRISGSRAIFERQL